MAGGAASPAGRRVEGGGGVGGQAEWLRIYNCLVAILRKSQAEAEALAADRAYLVASIKIQCEKEAALLHLLRSRVDEERAKDARRRRCEAANVELLLGEKEREERCYKKFVEIAENDLEDFRTSIAALDLENSKLKQAYETLISKKDKELSASFAEISELKTKLKEFESHAKISENTLDQLHSPRDLKLEIRKLKQAYKTLSSEKDKEITALLAEKAFVWNQLSTMEQDYTVLLKTKKTEAAQASKAAQTLQKNVEELQATSQKKDDEIARLQAEAGDDKKKIAILENKLQEMLSLVKEKEAEIEELKSGQPKTSQKHKKKSNETHRKSRSEGPLLREKSLNGVTPLKRKVKTPRTCALSVKESRSTSCRNKVEGGQPENSQKRKRGSSSHVLQRCSARLQVRPPVSPAVQPLLFSPSFSVPKLKTPTPL